MEIKRTGIAGVVIMLAVIVYGCYPEEIGGMGGGGNQIEFGASTFWLNDSGTRTEYSGETATVGSTKYERINWVINKDQIRIYSNQASTLSPSSHYSDYVISTDPTNSGAISSAGIRAVNGNGLQWNEGVNAHYFWAFYPASGSKWKYNENRTGANTGASFTGSGNTATITGKIPATQEVFWNSAQNECEPNMNYAYMYAGAYAARPGSSVSLQFRPLVTTLEFTIAGVSGDLMGSNLTKLELSSIHATLTGNFTASLSFNSSNNVNTPTITTGSGLGNKITIDLGSGVTLSTTPIKVTFLMLPVLQKNLKLTLYFGTGSSQIKRTLELTQRASTGQNFNPIEIKACSKAYVHDLSVRGTMYYLEVSGPSKSVAREGASNINFTVKSYKMKESTKTAVAWKAVSYSTDNGATWSTTPPSGFNLGTTSSTASSGLINGVTYTNASLNANPATNTVSRPWRGDTNAESGNSETNAIDLSMRDVNGNAVSKRETANCYVVRRPGWYKFPDIYGNAIVDGAGNATAYTNNHSNGTYKVLKNFLRHNGTGILQGDIHGHYSSVSLTPKLLWMDASNLITQVKVKDNWMYFYVPTGQRGNAVLAMLVNGEIVWSWHIWVTDEDLTPTAVYSYSSSSAAYPNYMMPVDLGWCEWTTHAAERVIKVRIAQNDSGGGKTAEFEIHQQPARLIGTNVTYQWGRKDPMLGCKDNGSIVNADQYYINNDQTYKFQVVNYADQGSMDANIAYGIKHPNYFFSRQNASWYSGFTDSYVNLWNVYGTFNTDKKVTKSVYDPCPPGYCVPNLYAFTGFSLTGYGSAISGSTSGGPNTVGFWDGGHHFKRSSSDTQGIFFPVVPLRNNDGGTLLQNRDASFYWTASLVSVSGRNDLPGFMEYSGLNYISTVSNTGAGAFGFNIRPVKMQ